MLKAIFYTGIQTVLFEIIVIRDILKSFLRVSLRLSHLMGNNPKLSIGLLCTVYL